MKKYRNSKNPKFRNNSELSPSLNQFNSLYKDNSSIEYKLAKLIKEKRNEINIQLHKFKIQKMILDKIENNYKQELSKYKEHIHNINILEKEAERIEKDISKVNKKKIYNILTILELKTLFKPSNKNKNCIFLLNPEWVGEKNNCDNYLEMIIQNQNEFYYYLKNLEKYYKKLEKENQKDFNDFKATINRYLENDNLSYPYDKLLFYLQNIIHEIELSYLLKEKYGQLKEIEIKKNLVYGEVIKLDSEKNEKENVIKEINNYIDLLKGLMQKFIHYQKQYHNNLISKDTLSQKLLNINSVNLQQWNPMEENKSSTLDMNDNLPQNTSIYNNHEKYFSQRQYDNENKCQIISKTLTVDRSLTNRNLSYKENKIDNKDNDLVNLLQDSETDKENISENSEKESPVSRINNIINKKYNSINVYEKKLSDKIKNIRILKKKNDFKTMTNDNTNNINNFNKIFCNSKTSSSSNLKCNIISSNKQISECKTKLGSNDSLDYNKIPNNIQMQTINKKNEIINKFPNDNKQLYFIKKIKKNKKFFINKNKLFNQKISPKTSNLKSILNIQNKQSTEILLKGIDNERKAVTNREKKSSSQSNHIYLSENNKNNLDKISIIEDYKNKFLKDNELNYTKQSEDLKYIYNETNNKKCTDSIKAIKDEMRKRNFLSITKHSTSRGGKNKNYEIKTNLKSDSCCISCT